MISVNTEHFIHLWWRAEGISRFIANRLNTRPLGFASASGLHPSDIDKDNLIQFVWLRFEEL